MSETRQKYHQQTMNLIHSLASNSITLQFRIALSVTNCHIFASLVFSYPPPPPPFSNQVSSETSKHMNNEEFSEFYPLQ